MTARPTPRSSTMFRFPDSVVKQIEASWKETLHTSP